MSGFLLHLQDATRSEWIEGVVSFVGEDRSGSFSIWAGHARMMTALVFGLARFRRAGQGWEYIALPGGIVYVADNTLSISTRRYLRDSDYERILVQLEEQLLREEESLHDMKESLQRMEEEVLKRLWRLGHAGGLGV